MDAKRRNLISTLRIAGLGWLLALVLASAVGGAVLLRVAPIGVNPGLAVLESDLLRCVQIAAAEAYWTAGQCSRSMRHYKVTINVLMLAFVAYESYHIAKIAWRTHRQGERKNRIIRVVRLALMLAICAGPIVYYLSETMPMPEKSDAI